MIHDSKQGDGIERSVTRTLVKVPIVMNVSFLFSPPSGMKSDFTASLICDLRFDSSSASSCATFRLAVEIFELTMGVGEPFFDFEGGSEPFSGGVAAFRFLLLVFFEESWTELVVSQSPYNTESITRTTNAQDQIFQGENSVSFFLFSFRLTITSAHHLPTQGGFNATMQLKRLGTNINDGLLGYITLGINPSASYSFHSTAYYTGGN